VKGKSGKAGLSVLGYGTLIMHGPDAGSLSMAPGELFGFGTGEFNVKNQRQIRGHPVATTYSIDSGACKNY